MAENTQVKSDSPTATYQQGELLYPDDTGETQIISAGQMATLDAGCQICNTCRLSQSRRAPIPTHWPISTAMPAANGHNLGDGGYNKAPIRFLLPTPSG